MTSNGIDVIHYLKVVPPTITTEILIKEDLQKYRFSAILEVSIVILDTKDIEWLTLRSLDTSSILKLMLNPLSVQKIGHSPVIRKGLFLGVNR